jgi:hypothetical protein
MVWLNGVKQINGTDVIVTSGANVGFAVTPPNNYIIDVFGYQGAVGFSNTFVLGNSVITNTNIYVGNSTVNSAITSTSFITGNTTILGSSITVGNSTVNTNFSPNSFEVTNTAGDIISVNTTIVYFGTNVVLGNTTVRIGIQANGSYGTSGQVLASNGSATYWTTPTTYATTGKAIAMAMVFGG